MGKYTLLPSYTGSKSGYEWKIRCFFDPACKKYTEPFFGGGALGFAIPNQTYESMWFNDRDPNLAIMYKALTDEETQEDAIKEIMSIEKSDDEEVAKAVFNEAVKNKLSTDSPNIERYKGRYAEICKNTYIVYSQSINGSGYAYSAEMSNAKYKRNVEQRLENAMSTLVYNNPAITCMDGIEVMRQVVDDPEMQIYADFPYVGLYRKCDKLYNHEMAGLARHIEGAEVVKNSKAAVIISGYRSQYKYIPTIYDAILTGDEWHCFEIKEKANHSQRVKKGKKKQRAREFIWTNRVPDGAELSVSMKDYKEKITLEEYWEKIRKACKEKRLPKAHVREYKEVYLKLYGKELI